MEGISKQSNQNLFKLFLAFSVFAHLVMLVSKTPGLSFIKVFDRPEEKIIKITTVVKKKALFSIIFFKKCII